MVEYLYTGHYKVQPRDSEDKCDAASPPTFHARMFALADKYLIDGLQNLSAAEFKKAVRCEESTCSLLRSINEIYSLECESSQTLRDIIVQSIRARTLPPLKSDVAEALDEITNQVPNFTKDIFISLLRQPMLGYCDHCGRDKLVPLVSLQCRCKSCGKGGASLLGERNYGGSRWI